MSQTSPTETFYIFGTSHKKHYFRVSRSTIGDPQGVLLETLKEYYWRPSGSNIGYGSLIPMAGINGKTPVQFFDVKGIEQMDPGECPYDISLSSKHEKTAFTFLYR